MKSVVQVVGRMFDASGLVHMMNDTTPAGLFSKKPIGVYVTDQRLPLPSCFVRLLIVTCDYTLRLQQFRAKVKQAEIEEERRRKEAAGGATEGGFFSSVKNWTNKQVVSRPRVASVDRVRFG